VLHLFIKSAALAMLSRGFAEEIFGADPSELRENYYPPPSSTRKEKKWM